MIIAQTEGYDKFKALAVATDISPPGEYNTSFLTPSAALIGENLASPCGMCRQLYVLYLPSTSFFSYPPIFT